MTKTIKKQIEKFEYREKSLARSVFSVFVLLLVFYGFLLINTFSNAIKRQQIDKEVSVLNSTINSMEANYLEVKNSITMDLALSKGFIVARNQKFVSISPVSTGLSLSINENQ